MKDFDVKIFESRLKDEALNRAKEELNKNPKFEINDDNITEFVDCKFILDILKENKIEYRIVADDEWTNEGRMIQYNLMVCIYISKKDYNSIKYLLESEKQSVEVDADVENDKITKIMNIATSILVNLICFIIGIPFFLFGIKLIEEDISTAIIFIIIGGGIVIFRIVKISKYLINKFTKKL